jgi:hypothetical protein
MDHLPRFSTSVAPLFEVPYLCSHLPYEGNGFLGYPKGMGLDELQLSHLDAVLPKDALDAFLQVWLFFGALHEIFGQVLVSDFVRQGQRGMQVTSSRLEDYIQRWVGTYETKSSEEKEVMMNKSSVYLREVFQFLHGHARYQEAASPRPEIWLSVNALLDTVSYRLKCLHGIGREGGPPIIYQTVGDKALRSYMLGQGWCLSEIKRLAQNHTLNEFYFAATMDRRGGTADHSACSEIVCLASQVDEKTYKTKHTTDTCCCKFIGPSEEQLCSILNAGGNPVVRLPLEVDMSTSYVEVFDSRNVLYTAVSHVWSDGLGNVAENKLPICQIREMNHSITALRSLRNNTEFTTATAFNDDPPYIWIDTFCVPIQGKYRKIAIRRMSQVYGNADAVLVLDLGLLHASFSSLLGENLKRITHSRWMQRLWTLQEGALARKLMFRFSDFIMVLSDAFEAWEDMCRQTIVSWTDPGNRDDRSYALGLSGHAELRNLSRINSQTGALRIMAAWSSAIGRTASKMEDEPVVFASLLGLDVGELLVTPPEQRQKKLFSLLKEVPQDIIFHDGARIAEDSWRWAPLRLDSITWKLHSPLSGRQCGSGFLVKFPGLHLLEAERLDRAPFCVVDTVDNTEYFFLVNDHEADGGAAGDAMWERVRPRSRSRCALVLNHLPKDHEDTYGLFVTIAEEKEGVIYAKYVCRVLFKQVGEVDRRTLGAFSYPFPPLFISARSTNESQQWCIG